LVETQLFVRRQPARRMRDQAGEVEPGHRADHQPRIEFGRIDAFAAESGGQRAAGGLDAECRAHAAPCAASCAA